MKTEIEVRKYNDVDVIINKDKESGIIRSKTFTIKKNEESVRDRLRIMCIKHDLRYINCTTSIDKPQVLCCLKMFNSVNDFLDYFTIKANKHRHSFKLKGEFVLAKIEDKSYIYRVVKDI